MPDELAKVPNMTGGTNKTNGYTIVETLIFLAVSALIAISALLLVSGRQRSTEFTDGLRDLENKIQDVMNDVATGYYPNDGTIECTDNGVGVDFAVGSSEQGTNEDCIFVGKVIQFAPDGTENRGLTIYTVAGRRTASGAITTSISQAAPKIIFGGALSGLVDRQQVGPIKIAHVGIGAGSGASHGGIAILTNFKGYNGFGSLESGSISSDTYPITATGSVLGQAEDDFVNAANLELTGGLASANPSAGVAICVESQGTDQHAEILIGGPGASPTTTSVIYYNGSACP